jgi:hypothetical protein
MPWLSITFKYHFMLRYGMESKLTRRQVAIAYRKWLKEHLAVVRMNNIPHGYCIRCYYGVHEEVEPNIARTGSAAASCCCRCHWGLKP